MSGPPRWYAFEPKALPTFVKATAEAILKAAERGEGSVRISLDLGLSTTDVSLRDNFALLHDGAAVDLRLLEPILKDEEGVYVLDGGELKKVAFSVGGLFYKLVCVRHDTAPTLEISGIHMHRIKGITPWEDTLEKVRAARIRKGVSVLDVCTGLGYTAIASLELGASSVITVEKDENVLKIASVNPWSRGLADPRIKIALADAAEFVKRLPNESFDRIIHDPPRFALAGELYGLEFYRELYRALKPGGILFHYTGEPGRLRGLNVPGGVSGRLKRAGFQVLERRAMGFVARRPK